MGRYSFVLVGTERGNVQRPSVAPATAPAASVSRTAAVKAARGRDIGEELRARGVSSRATGRHALEEEMPEAYKDVQDVVGVVEGFGISKRVCAAAAHRCGEGLGDTLTVCPGP